MRIVVRLMSNSKGETFARLDSSLVTLFLVYFLIPTVVDRIADDLPIAGVDVADEKDLDVVLDGDEFRVVDPRFPRDFFAVFRHLDSHWRKAHRRLAVEFLGFLAPFVDNAVFFGLHTSFFASFATVREDRPVIKRAN